MLQVAVVYFSQTGVTAALASSLVEGLQQAENLSVQTYSIEGRKIVEGRFVDKELFVRLARCDAIIFGSPTYMGGAAAQFKAFADATSDLWCEQEWANKLAAGFTCGSAANGDQTGTLQYFVTLANQHGMLWLGLDAPNGYGEHQVNRLGCQLGVVAQSEDGSVHSGDLATAKYLGRRMAKQLARTK